MGVDELQFYEAIASFKGASKRLEKLQNQQIKLLIKILHIHQVKLPPLQKRLKHNIQTEN